MIHIDNYDSTTISNKSSHFVGTIMPVKVKMVENFGGLVQVRGEGAIVWKIEDDDGIVHPIKIKKAPYVPEALECLLAPQQWAQKANNNCPKLDGTWCATRARHFII